MVYHRDLFEKIYFITIDPEDKSPGVLCNIMNTINYYITMNGGFIELDHYNSDLTFGKMAFKLGDADPDTALCYITSLPGVKMI